MAKRLWQSLAPLEGILEDRLHWQCLHRCSMRSYGVQLAAGRDDGIRVEKRRVPGYLHCFYCLLGSVLGVADYPQTSPYSGRAGFPYPSRLPSGLYGSRYVSILSSPVVSPLID